MLLTGLPMKRKGARSRSEGLAEAAAEREEVSASGRRGARKGGGGEGDSMSSSRAGDGALAQC